MICIHYSQKTFRRVCISLDALTPLFKNGHFSLIWYASLNNKTFPLYDWSIILVFRRTRFNLNSCVLASFKIKLLMENKLIHVWAIIRLSFNRWVCANYMYFYSFEECSLSFSNIGRFRTRTWKLVTTFDLLRMFNLSFIFVKNDIFVTE